MKAKSTAKPELDEKRLGKIIDAGPLLSGDWKSKEELRALLEQMPLQEVIDLEDRELVFEFVGEAGLKMEVFYEICDILAPKIMAAEVPVLLVR